MTEFNLSDKRIIPEQEGGYLLTRDVKEFIRLLKEEFILYRTNKAGEQFITARDKWFLRNINKLAGEEFI